MKSFSLQFFDFISLMKEVKIMYRPIDKLQHSFLDFNQPMGLKLKC